MCVFMYVLYVCMYVRQEGYTSKESHLPPATSPTTPAPPGATDTKGSALPYSPSVRTKQGDSERVFKHILIKKKKKRDMGELSDVSGRFYLKNDLFRFARKFERT